MWAKRGTQRTMTKTRTCTGTAASFEFEIDVSSFSDVIKFREKKVSKRWSFLRVSATTHHHGERSQKKEEFGLRKNSVGVVVIYIWYQE
jgi:hypothetical protein